MSPEKMLVGSLLLFFFVSYFFALFGPKKLRASKCGHTFYKNERVVAFGETIKIGWNEQAEYCPSCTAAKAIQCCYCESAIVFGDPVVAYMPSPDDPPAPPGKRYMERISLFGPEKGESRKVLVGCGGCADSAADINGVWMPPGHVQSQKNGYERAFEERGTPKTDTGLFESIIDD